MKKLSLILASALLLGSISFASPVVVKKQAAKAPVAKQDAKPAAKTTKKNKEVKKSAPKKAAPTKQVTK
jgi:hypothetical protein